MFDIWPNHVQLRIRGYHGILDGRSQKFHVDFEKCQYCMSLLLIFANVTCQIYERLYPICHYISNHHVTRH